MHLRALKKFQAEVSLYNPIGVDKEGNELAVIDVLGSEQDLVGEAVESSYERKKILEEWKKLAPRERKVLAWRYGLFDGLEKTQREIARKLGISRSYVSRIEKKAIKKLLKELNQQGRDKNN